MRYQHDTEDEYDLTAMIAKPLYFGMFVNVLIPAVLVFICYYINNRYYQDNYIPAFANTLFYVLCGVSLVQAAVALWWRNKSFSEPMVRRAESFEHDLATEIQRRSKPVFLLIAAIMFWGLLYFGLTGRFRESVVFAVFSFVVFQVVRPRYGSLRRLIAFQQELVAKGQLRGGSLADARKEIEGE
jgi:Gpi18-like mannosyltransferase